MAIGNYLEEKWMKHTYGGAAFTQPTSWTMHLYTSDPADDDSGNEVDTTVDDTAYASQTFTPSVGATPTFDVSNSNVITFPAVVYGTGGAPYTVTHFAIKDNSSGLCHYQAFSSPITRSTGQTLVFSASTVVLSVT